MEENGNGEVDAVKEVAGQKLHMIKILNIPQDVYESMWNLRRRYKATSWLKLITMITEEMKAEVKETEWI